MLCELHGGLCGWVLSYLLLVGGGDADRGQARAKLAELLGVVHTLDLDRLAVR